MLQNTVRMSKWITFPSDYLEKISSLFPLVLAMMLQRVFHVLDNRFVNTLGSEALLIHNVQYIFIVFGQFMGTATATSGLIFWKREECVQKQGSVFMGHVMLGFTAVVIFAFGVFLFRENILRHYSISQEYMGFAKIYLLIGLVNMILQAMYGSLDGFLVATGQQRICMVLALFLVSGNLIFDYAAVHWIWSGEVVSPTVISAPMFVIIGSTTFLGLIVTAIATRAIIKKIQGWKHYAPKDIFRVWRSEAMIAVMRSLTPMIFAYQLGLMTVTKGFLVTYNLSLHIVYVFCLPLAGGLQIALRDASANKTHQDENNWMGVLIYTALLPTTVLLIIVAMIPEQILELFYGFLPPDGHRPFIAIFILGCLIGQFGHVFALPLRVAKKNHLLTRNIIFAEYFVLLGGTQILVMKGWATPGALGLITVLYCSAYLVMNLFGVRSMGKENDLLETTSEKMIMLKKITNFACGIRNHNVGNAYDVLVQNLKFFARSCLGFTRGMIFGLQGRLYYEDKFRPLILPLRFESLLLGGGRIVLCDGDPSIPLEFPFNPNFPEASSLGVMPYWKYINPPVVKSLSMRLQENSQLILCPNTIVYRGAYISIWSDQKIYIGKNTAIGASSFINSRCGMHIGNNVLIGHETILMDYDGHPVFHKDKPVLDDTYGGDAKPIRIEDDVWIAFRAIILKGVTIGRGSIVAANSCVTSDVPPNTLVAGNPARIVKENISWKKF